MAIITANVVIDRHNSTCEFNQASTGAQLPSQMEQHLERRGELWFLKPPIVDYALDVNRERVTEQLVLFFIGEENKPVKYSHQIQALRAMVHCKSGLFAYTLEADIWNLDLVKYIPNNLGKWIFTIHSGY